MDPIKNSPSDPLEMANMPSSVPKITWSLPPKMPGLDKVLELLPQKD